ncbi:MAG: hypothetical protein ABH956_03255 [Candidatus Nealsonbacteria bacterium]
MDWLQRTMDLVRSQDIFCPVHMIVNMNVLSTDLSKNREHTIIYSCPICKSIRIAFFSEDKQKIIWTNEINTLSEKVFS